MSEPAAPVPRKYRIAIRRPVATAMFFLTLVVFGWRSYQQLPINLMPDISYPTLTVRTEYEGAAPEDVEKLVTRPLEEMLSIVGGMVEIRSISSPGVSEIILEFTWDTDMNVAMQDVRDRLDLFMPPRELTEKPVILRYDPTLDPVMQIAITPSSLPKTGTPAERQQALTAALTTIREAAERYLKSDLEAEPGVAQVAVKGGQEEEIQVLVNADLLKNRGMSLEYLVNNLAQQNINLSGGRLKEGSTEYLVRTLNEFQTVDEIKQSVITTPFGGQLLLQDVAAVYLGTKERETIVHRNGVEAVALEIYKEGDANTVKVCDRVKELLNFPREIGFIERIRSMIEEQTNEMRRSLRDMGQIDLAEVVTTRNLLERLPKDIHLAIITDQSRFIVGAIAEVKDAVIWGGLLSLLVLYVFLQDLTMTLFIGVSIPISLIATFVPMYAGDITLNIMSLGGLALGVGMLVDNSIVVIESIFRCREEGDSPLDSAERGTQEVAGAITDATLNTVAVFFPLAFVQGIAGQLFSDLAMTVAFSLLASLLAALYLVPLIASRRSDGSHAAETTIWFRRAYRELRDSGMTRSGAVAHIPRRSACFVRDYLRQSFDEIVVPSLQTISRTRQNRGFSRYIAVAVSLLFLPAALFFLVLQATLKAISVVTMTILFIVFLAVGLVLRGLRRVFRTLFWLPLALFNVGFGTFRAAYGGALESSLKFSGVILLLVVGLALHAGVVARGLGRDLIPALKQGEFIIRMESPPGTRLDITASRAQRLEDIIREMEIVDSVTVQVGEEDTATRTDRGENVAEFNVTLKDPEKSARMQDSVIEELRRRLHAATNDEITFSLPSLFTFKTPVEVQIVGDDLSELRRLGKEATALVAQVPGVADAELSLREGYPEIIVEMDRELLASRGLSPGQVANRLRREVQGEVATRFSQGGEKVDVRVRTDKELLNSKEDLFRLNVSDEGTQIPLSDVARIEIQEGPSEIRRVDQKQVVLVTANVEGRDLGAVSDDIVATVGTIEMPPNYYSVLGGQNRELDTSYKSLRFALLLGIFLVYVVMACQFESIWHPLLIMFSVPLAFVGVVYTLSLLDSDLNIMVYLGGIILASIVVDNAIVLVDYINQLRRRGLKKPEAIVEAGKARLRPILMTALTTVLGLVPMVFSSGEGAELRRPMAITMMSGLLCATFLTLFIIPMAYFLFGGRDKS